MKMKDNGKIVSKGMEKLHNLGVTETLQKVAEHIGELEQTIEQLKKEKQKEFVFEEPEEWR